MSFLGSIIAALGGFFGTLVILAGAIAILCAIGWVMRAVSPKGSFMKEASLPVAAFMAFLLLIVLALVYAAIFAGQSWMLWVAGVTLAIAAGGWLFRFAGQKVTGNAPRFRDMPFGVAFGYILAASALIFAVWFYFQPTITEQGAARASVIFFRWAVQGFLIFAISAFIFKRVFMYVGSSWSRRMFATMPLTAAFGILMILIYAFVAIFAPLLAPYPQDLSSFSANIIPGGDPALGGNPEHPLGTDQIGRDILSRLIFGARNTVGIAFATTCLAFAIGASLGFLAATLGGWLDNLLSRAIDVLMAIPSLIFALLLMTIASVWAPRLGIPLTLFMVVIIAVIDSTRVYRLARAVGLNIVVMDYIEAAKLRGEGLRYLIFREILPNATAPLLAEFGLRFCFVFLTIAALSFLGVGIQPPLADWGTMVRDMAALINYAQFAPQAAVTPLLAAGAIALLTVAVNFVVDWMLHKSSGLKE